jgi:hypothetical protein
MLTYRPRMRLVTLLALALTAGCSTQPKYQGDVVLGSFAFSAVQDADDCPFDFGDAGPRISDPSFRFSGVFSYDSARSVLFLDTDGVREDDHVGTLTGTHFVLLGHALRDLRCGAPTPIEETLEGDLFPSGVIGDGGCEGLSPDAGPLQFGDGGVRTLVPVVACGSLGDAVHPDAGGCPTCSIHYRLQAVRQ